MIRDTLNMVVPVASGLLAVCLAMITVANAEPSLQGSGSDKGNQARTRRETARQSTEQKARPEIENQRKQLEQQAESALDKEAVEAIDETEKAIDAISKNKTDEALAAIEQATGKINVLLGRNPATALIPVNAEVDVIDTAPRDHQMILEIAQDASRAVDDRDFPDARILLHALMSEIRVRTYNLPLATYPAALTDAARLLDQKKNQDASMVLLQALNTLVAVDRVTPIPLLLAQEAVNQAQAQRDKDKATAQKLLETAKDELLRARDLGYAGKDAEYASLNAAITDLEKQLKGSGDTNSVFARLKEKLDAFLRQESQTQRQKH